jgi:hypothetical protein
MHLHGSKHARPQPVLGIGYLYRGKQRSGLLT